MSTQAAANAAVNPQEGGGSLWWEAFRRLLRKPTAVMSLVYIVILFLVAIFAHKVAPYDFAVQDFKPYLDPGSPGHLLGTDDLGRDILSRIIFGTRASMQVAMTVLVISLVVGLTLGSIAGYYGGKIDMVLMRLTDITFAFPDLLFAILLLGILGAGMQNVLIALGVVAWPGLARLVRGQVLTLKELEYVQAARSLGCNDFTIIVRHLLPNLLSPVLVQSTQSIAGFILSEAVLSFLGIGIRPPQPSWGSMLTNAAGWIYSYPKLLLGPCVVLALTVLAFNFLGDGLRDALDPRLRH